MDKKIRESRLLPIGVLIFCLMLIPLNGVEGDQKVVWKVTVEGIVSPVMADFVVETLDKAQDAAVECVIIALDTPGGLDLSMREIVKEIMASSVPVIVFVYPQGSRAASAGVWITLASHVAIMSPGTNIGAAHPVMMGGPPDIGDMDPGGVEEEGEEEAAEDAAAENGEGEKTEAPSVMEEKVLNDAVAYIKAIAEERGRNAEWAEQAVRESVSITAEEALELGVIDLVCANVDEVLEKIDGRTVLLEGEEKTLETVGARLVEVEMALKYRFLKAITNPSIAYLLMMLGVWGIFFELSNPGSILPGVVGVVFLVLALYALNQLPINYAGVALIVLAIVLFIAEVKITSFGLLTVGGVISMVLGSVMLIDSDFPFLRISWTVIIPAVLLTAGFFVVAFGLVLRAHKRKPTTGREGLLHEVTTAETEIGPSGGRVFLQGELWDAVSDRDIEKGKRVKVVAINHMTLKVEEIEE